MSETPLVVSKKPLFILLAAFALLVLMHSASTPIFEAPDEVWHYAYVRWLVAGHGLPSMDDNASGANQEVAQPPLYYAVAALLSAPFPDGELDLWSNPGFGHQAPGTSGDNKNMLIHTRDEDWPWRGGVLTLHVTRLTSLLFGLVTVVAAWGLGAEAFGNQRGARLTAMLVAFHPQFVFMCSVVSNDSAAAALATAGLWATARVLRRGLTVRRAAVAGALVGLAMLTKSSVVLLLPLAGTALVLATWKQTQRGTRNKKNEIPRYARNDRLARFGNRGYVAVIVFVGIALVAGGWWYGRNLVLYGDALGISSHADTPWGRAEMASLVELGPELPLLLRSFWAAYGWGHVSWAAWVYWMLWAGALALLVRSGRRIMRTVTDVWRKHADTNAETELVILLLALAWFGGVLAALLQWMRQVQAPHGRLLFPSIGAWAVLLANGAGSKEQKTESKRQALGIGQIGPRTSSLILRLRSGQARRFANVLIRLFITFIFVLTALAPGIRILATFSSPRLRTATAVTQSISPVGFNYAQQARLVSISTDQERVAPGETVAVKACWEGLIPMAKDYTVFVHLIGPENSRVAERHTYPGLGRFPTSLWPVGRAFCDTYRLRIEPWADGPILYKLEIGLFDAETGERLPASRADGSSAEPPVVDVVSVVPELQIAESYPIDAYFGETIVLNGYDGLLTATPGKTVDITLYWETLRAPEDDLVAFVHLWQPGDEAPLAQHDSQPRQGWYPTTVWQEGDHVPDTHPLEIPVDLPPGKYPLWAGLYRAADGVRIALEGTERQYQHDLVPLGSLEVK